MNNRNNRHIATVRAVVGSVALASTLTTLGCSSEKPFAKINGLPVSQEEYIHMLERQNVVIPNGQTTNAEKLVIDQMIGNRVILAEAAKVNAVPADEEVKRYYELQKKLFENQYPGKSYETSMKDQGTTPPDVQSDMKNQMAEANLYAIKLKIGDKEVREAYEKAHGDVGLPARVQLRLILVAPNSLDMQKAQQLLNNKTPFDDVAKQINPPQLRIGAGLIQQATPVSSLAPDLQPKIQQNPEGAFFGPVNLKYAPNQPEAKAWVKIEKKLPAYKISLEDAAPLVKKQLVANALANPANQSARNEIINTKLAAKFEPTDPNYTGVWDALKKSAEESGLGHTTPSAGAAPVAAPAASLTAPAPK